MQKTKRCTIGFRQRRPVNACFFQQMKGAVDIRANKIVGAVDRPVDVTLGGEVDDSAGLFSLQQVAKRIAINNVSLLETIVRMSFYRTQVAEIARVGQFVEIRDMRWLGGDPMQDEVRADEARAARDQDEILH